MMNCPGGGMGAWMGSWALISLALLVLLVLLIIWLIRSMSPGGRGRTDQPQSQSQSHDETLEILRRRYAAGEIDEEEYHRRRNGLRGD